MIKQQNTIIQEAQLLQKSRMMFHVTDGFAKSPKVIQNYTTV